MEDLYTQIEAEVKKAKKILCISHRSPDADTLGAALAMRYWFNRLRKQTTLACIDKPSSRFRFLNGVEDFVDEFEVGDYDLIVIVDAGASYMTNFHLKYPDFFETEVPMINIDHHASNDFFGNINLVDPQAASVTLMIHRMFDYLGIDIDVDTATALLAGIYNDTGSFKHSNTDAEVLAVSSDLMGRGADFAQISKNLFKRNAVDTLKLWGRVMEKAYVNEEGVVMSVVNTDDYQDLNAGPNNLSGVIDYLNMVPDTKFSVLVTEDGKGNVKGSMRSKSDVDVARIAAVFGGGGHAKASGFRIPGRLKKEVRYSIVSNEDQSTKSLDFDF